MPNMNISTAHTSKFRLVFPYLPFVGDTVKDRGEKFVLYCSDITLPSVDIEVENITNQMFTMKNPTRNITFGDISATYSVDEMFENYELLNKWMLSMKDPEKLPTNVHLGVDASLFIYSNNDNPKFHFRLINVFPSHMDEISFSHKDSTSDDLENNVTFAVEYFYLDRSL